MRRIRADAEGVAEPLKRFFGLLKGDGVVPGVALGIALILAGIMESFGLAMIIGAYVCGLGFAKDFHEKSLDELMGMLAEPSSERQFIMYEALRKGADVDALFKRTHIKHWFITQMKELVELEEKIISCKGATLPDELLIQAKKDGFADRYLLHMASDPSRPEVLHVVSDTGAILKWD